jgi:hypothetical protein
VQLATFGRELNGSPDSLMEFALSMLEITEPKVIATSGARHHPVLRRTGTDHDEVPGMVFDITAAELLAADAYEVDDYERVQVRSKRGRDVFVLAE